AVAKVAGSGAKPAAYAKAGGNAKAGTTAKLKATAAAKPKVPVKAGKPVATAAKADKSTAKATAASLAAVVKGVPSRKPSVGEIAAKIAGKRAEDAAHRKGKNGKHVEAPRELTPADVEARKRRLKTLIVLGKERGYLTYAEINDHLPDDILDAEHVEEEAEAAASTLDSEFGRTTDPVRMYMREMGSVELLTREGEIEIAKRIEEGLKHMILAISACPMTVQQILELADKIAKDELKIDDVVDGLLDFNEQLTAIEDESDDVDDDEDEEESADPGSIESENLERLKVAALERFGTIRKHFTRMLAVLTKDGHKAPRYLDLQKKISAELMQIRFSARMVEKLCD